VPFFKTPGEPFRTQFYDSLVPFPFPARRELTDYLSVRAQLLLRSPVFNPKAVSRHSLFGMAGKLSIPHRDLPISRRNLLSGQSQYDLPYQHNILDCRKNSIHSSFVSGHDFSRAAKTHQKGPGFSPCYTSSRCRLFWDRFRFSQGPCHPNLNLCCLKRR